MDYVKIEDSKPGTSTSSAEEENKKSWNDMQYFECALCKLREKYEYFGKDPPFMKCFKLVEDSYVIEDPFTAPKQGEVLILGGHCFSCKKMVCRDTICSIFYEHRFCIDCAKNRKYEFPKVVQEKLNKIVR